MNKEKNKVNLFFGVLGCIALGGMTVMNVPTPIFPQIPGYMFWGIGLLLELGYVFKQLTYNT